jgi:hypothetical protein
MERASVKLRELVEQGLLYVGIPAITLYPLGFVALGIQLWRDPFFPYVDFDSVWEAVAIVPHTVVIATGVRLVYLALIATIFGWGISSLTFRIMGRHTDEQPVAARRSGLWGIYLIVFMPLAGFLVFSGIDIDKAGDILYLIGFVVFSVGGGVLVGFLRSRGYENLILASQIGAYFGAVFAALCISALYTPSLPIVTIQSEIGEAPDCSTTLDRTFVMLDETPGYWHVYNKTGLYSLNESEVESVRYQNCQEREIRP